MIVYNPNSEIAVKSDPDYPTFPVTSVQVVIEAGETTPVVNKDANLLVSDSATIRTDGQINYQLSESPSFTASNPGVATVNSTGYVTRVSNGTAKILVEQSWNKQNVFVPVSYQTGETTSALASWVTGSFAKFASDRILGLASGVSPSPETRSINGTNFFCLPYRGSMSGVAIEVNGSSWMGFTAITTRHVITVAHIGDYTGGTVTFNGGTRVNRTLIKRYAVPGIDVAVYLLDSDLPTSVRPLRLLPSTLSNYLPNPQYSVPVLFLDRNSYVNIGATESITSTSIGVGTYSGVNPGFYDPPAEGTSGKPIMIPTGVSSVQFAVMGLFTYPKSGPALHALDWTSIIPAVDALAGVSTGLQPARVSLGSYNFYS